MPDTATPLLLAPPSVFAVEDEYQICVAVSGDCTMMVDVGGLCCCDHANGVLRSRRRIHIAHVPAAALDRAGGYTVRLRPILDRRPYFSETGPEQVTSWSFRPIPAGKPVRIINLADAHNLVDEPVAAGAYFGDSLDLLILNGDIPEHAGALSHLLNIYSIAGRITGGARPCVFVRGNHDMRGIHAEDLPEYTPTAAGKSYYTFRTGPVWGIVLDTGEDKSDDHAEYGHTVCCEAFRREEDAFLDAVIASGAWRDAPIRLIISHNPFAHRLEPPFDIEQPRFAAWCRALRALDAQLWLTGHLHECFFEQPGGPHDTLGAPCPVLCSSDRRPPSPGKRALYLCGAVTFQPDGTFTTAFINQDGECVPQPVRLHTLP